MSSCSQLQEECSSYLVRQAWERNLDLSLASGGSQFASPSFGFDNTSSFCMAMMKIKKRMELIKSSAVLGWGSVNTSQEEDEDGLSLPSRKEGREATPQLGVSHAPHV